VPPHPLIVEQLQRAQKVGGKIVNEVTEADSLYRICLLMNLTFLYQMMRLLCF
jgi:hypothetical protein